MADPYYWDEEKALHVEQGSPNFYESPAVWINQKGNTLVRPKVSNLIGIEVQRFTDRTFSQSRFRVQAFMANPNVTTIKGKTALAANLPVRKQELDDGFYLFNHDWQFNPAGLADDHPLREGHKCMTVRVFPEISENRWPPEFNWGDPHEALRNMSVEKASPAGDGPGGAGQGMTGVPGVQPIGIDDSGVAEYLIEMVSLVPGAEDTVHVRPVRDLAAPERALVADQLDDAGFADVAPPGVMPPDVIDFDLPKDLLPTYWEPETLVAPGVEAITFDADATGGIDWTATTGRETVTSTITSGISRGTDIITGHYTRGVSELASQLATTATAQGPGFATAITTLGEQLRTGVETIHRQLTAEMRDLGAALMEDRPLSVDAFARGLKRAAFVPAVGQVVEQRVDELNNAVDIVVNASTSEITRFSLKVPMGDVPIGGARIFDVEQWDHEGVVLGGTRLMLVRGE